MLPPLPRLIISRCSPVTFVEFQLVTEASIAVVCWTSSVIAGLGTPASARVLVTAASGESFGGSLALGAGSRGGIGGVGGFVGSGVFLSSSLPSSCFTSSFKFCFLARGLRAFLDRLPLLDPSELLRPLELLELLRPLGPLDPFLAGGFLVTFFFSCFGSPSAASSPLFVIGFLPLFLGGTLFVSDLELLDPFGDSARFAGAFLPFGFALAGVGFEPFEPFKLFNRFELLELFELIELFDPFDAFNPFAPFSPLAPLPPLATLDFGFSSYSSSYSSSLSGFSSLSSLSLCSE